MCQYNEITGLILQQYLISNLLLTKQVVTYSKVRIDILTFQTSNQSKRLLMYYLFTVSCLCSGYSSRIFSLVKPIIRQHNDFLHEWYNILPSFINKNQQSKQQNYKMPKKMLFTKGLTSHYFHQQT
jgi:hypothetical protein